MSTSSKLDASMNKMVKHTHGLTIASLTELTLPDDLLFTMFETPRGRFLGVVVQPQILGEYLRQAGYVEPAQVERISLNRWGLASADMVALKHATNIDNLQKGSNG